LTQPGALNLGAIAAYIKGSLIRQDTPDQESVVRRYLVERGIKNAPVYRDNSTERTVECPGFRKLLGAVRDEKVEIVVVPRLQHLAYTLKGLLEVFDAFLAVRLVSIHDNFEIDSRNMIEFRSLLRIVTKFETETRAESVRAGIEAARKRGVRLGRPPGIQTPIKVTQERAAQVCRLKAEGQGVTQIARTVGLSRPSVYRILVGAA
jgi:DNA invertase Pin-like site-specific DNA recombinase